MKIGMIGAGKMGFTLGKHLAEGGYDLCGYASLDPQDAKAAAEFTNTTYYLDVRELVNTCDTLFLTVPDGQIKTLAGELDRTCSLTGKRLIHTSGALSSAVFSGLSQEIFGYSIHPIYAINSKEESYKGFGDCVITLEGHPACMEEFSAMFRALGHPVVAVRAEEKVRYHAACVMASNLVIGLYSTAVEELMKCGFDRQSAEKSLRPLFKNNAENLLAVGPRRAMTGPVERGDTETIRKHREVLTGDALACYESLTNALVRLKNSEPL